MVMPEAGWTKAPVPRWLVSEMGREFSGGWGQSRNPIHEFIGHPGLVSSQMSPS